MNIIYSLICGVLFGLGLTVSQMVDPQKVLNFLDVAGHWDASLAFVMGGGLLVFGIGYHFLIKPKDNAINGSKMPAVPAANIDKKLIIGSALFGVGWGISGVCPGPAIANTSSGNLMLFVFIGFMVIGLLVGTKLKMS